MTPAQFWEDDPWLVRAYLRANDLRIQKTSEEMWLQGLYFREALNSSLSNIFKKKGHKSIPYMEEPIRLIPYTEEEKEERARREREKTIAYFKELEKKWSKKGSAKC